MNNKYLIGVITLIIAISLCISPIAAVDWNNFQGDIKHTGYNGGSSDTISKVWSLNLDKGPILSSPLIYDNMLYIITENGILKVIDMNNSKVEWTYDFEDKVSASPIIKDDILYVGDLDGDFYALNVSEDLKDDKHETIWEKNFSDGIKSTVAIDDNNNIYFGSNDGHFYSLNKDGEENWNCELGEEVESSPIITNDTIYVGSTNGKIFAIDLNGNEKWNYTTAEKVVSSPAYTNESIYIGSEDGNLYCINSSTGTLKWNVNMENKIISSPTIDENDNNVFIGSNNGNITCFDTRDGTFKWSYTTGNAIESTPALYKDKVLINSNDGLSYMLNKYTGNVELKFNPGCYLFNQKITASPVVYGDNLVVADQSGYVHSIDLNKKETPITKFLYYDIIVVVILIIIIAVVIKVFKTRSKK